MWIESLPENDLGKAKQNYDLPMQVRGHFKKIPSTQPFNNGAKYLVKQEYDMWHIPFRLHI